MRGLDRFGSAVAETGADALQRVLSESPALPEGWGQHIMFGGPRPTRGVPPKLSGEERFAIDLLQKFSEVSNSWESLNSIYHMIRRAPTAAMQVEPTRYLRLLMEAWLNETYILRERCNVLLAFLDRSYRSDPSAAKVKAITREVKKKVASAFTGVARVRSSHVHQVRYDDDDLLRLSTLLVLASQNEIYRTHLRAATKAVRSAKATWLKERNLEVRHFLDRYFDSLHEIVFSNDGGTKFPGAA